MATHGSRAGGGVGGEKCCLGEYIFLVFNPAAVYEGRNFISGLFKITSLSFNASRTHLQLARCTGDLRQYSFARTFSFPDISGSSYENDSLGHCVVIQIRLTQ